MNANEASSKANPRLNRIKIVSRAAKHVCFGLLAFSIPFSILYISPFRAGVWSGLIVIMFQIVLWFWYWKLSRLFHFYERGMIFAAETIRCIKTLGLLWMAGWVIMTTMHFLPHPATNPQTSLAQPAPDTKAALPPGVTVASTPVVTRHFTYRMGFFASNFGTPIDFGPLLAGATILLIAWIMDEGRKIQEEQELTV